MKMQKKQKRQLNKNEQEILNKIKYQEGGLYLGYSYYKRNKP